MSKNKKCTFLADPALFQMYIISFFVMEGPMLYFLLNVIIGKLKADSFIGVVSEIAFMMVLWIAVMIWASNQWFMRISLREDGILMLPGVRKSEKRTYKHYQYVYKAQYWHGSPIGVGYIRYYIVFSHRRLKDEEVYNINNLVSSADVIKIKYSPKIYQRLMDILPKEMAYKLKVCGFEKIPPITK